MPSQPTTVFTSSRTNATFGVRLMLRVVETKLPTAEEPAPKKAERLGDVGRIVLAGFVAPMVVIAIIVIARHFLLLAQ